MKFPNRIEDYVENNLVKEWDEFFWTDTKNVKKNFRDGMKKNHAILVKRNETYKFLHESGEIFDSIEIMVRTTSKIQIKTPPVRYLYVYNSHRFSYAKLVDLYKNMVSSDLSETLDSEWSRLTIKSYSVLISVTSWYYKQAISTLPEMEKILTNKYPKTGLIVLQIINKHTNEIEDRIIC